MVDIYTLRELFQKLLIGLARKFPTNITPNQWTVISFLFAVFSAIFIFLSGKPNCSHWLILAGIFLFFSSFLDAIDGIIARQRNLASKKGDFLDHVFDRFADTILILGVVWAGYISWEIGLITLSAVLLVSYLGVQAQALGIQREYRGLMGRAYRLVILNLFIFLNAFWTEKIGLAQFQFSLLGWVMIIFAVFGIITICQRFFYTLQALNN